MIEKGPHLNGTQQSAAQIFGSARLPARAERNPENNEFEALVPPKSGYEGEFQAFIRDLTRISGSRPLLTRQDELRLGARIRQITFQQHQLMLRYLPALHELLHPAAGRRPLTPQARELVERRYSVQKREFEKTKGIEVTLACPTGALEPDYRTRFSPKREKEIMMDPDLGSLMTYSEFRSCRNIADSALRALKELDERRNLFCKRAHISRATFSKGLERVQRGEVEVFAELSEEGAREGRALLAGFVQWKAMNGIEPNEFKRLMRQLNSLERRIEPFVEEFAESNLRLVVSIAKRYADRGVPLIDLIIAGNGGLVEAVRQFIPEKGYKFSTMATQWIRKEVGNCVSDEASLVRVPRHAYLIMGKIRGAIAYLEMQGERDPTDQQIVQASRELEKKKEKVGKGTSFRLTARHVAQLRGAAASRILSEEQPGSESNETFSLLDGREAFEGSRLSEERRLIGIEMRHYLDQLEPIPQLVLRLRFGLNNQDREFTLDETAAYLFGMGVRSPLDSKPLSRERIRQIQTQAFKAIRALMEDDKSGSN